MNKWISASIWLAAVQWLFFLFANTVVVPLSIGAAFGFPAEQVTSIVKVTFIVTGLACMLQASLGHRYALMEGPAGLWWGLILSLITAAPSMGMTLSELGGALSVGIIGAGVITSLLGALGFGAFLKKVFTPMVMFVYLFLLSIQLILVFFKSMTGLSDGSQINVPITLLSIGIVLLVGLIGMKGKGMLGNFSILIGMVVGWVAYLVLFPEIAVSSTTDGGGFAFKLFPWGEPHWELGIIIAALLSGLINMTNTTVSLNAADKLYGEVSSDVQYKRSYHMTALHSILSGLFGLVPYGPYTSSIGFLESTKILDRRALVLGGALFMVLGLVPALGTLFASMPISVGGAVLFIVYFQLFGTAFQYLNGIFFNPKTVYRMAAPALIGISILYLPADAFSTLPELVRPILGNGLLMGVIVSLILENTINWSRNEKG